ncbi:hypothetical protein [Flavitalea sp.]|nr:hypothetical protein [Flavitalea sp.]
MVKVLEHSFLSIGDIWVTYDAAGKKVINEYELVDSNGNISNHTNLIKLIEQSKLCEEVKSALLHYFTWAYNLLAGRSVHKNLVSKEGNEYEAWVKLNFKNRLDDGNHEMKQCTKKYGFELENVLSKYPIKELTNEQYKQSLIDSLHRGNLQKATFVDKDDGKKSCMYHPILRSEP